MPTQRSLLLRAPLSGRLVALDRVPDPVFAERLAGDGVSIDPTSAELLAPCDGTVAQVHAAGHALTLRTAGDLDVMMHIGLDTVQLRGEGFTPLVAVGDRVRTGTPLIRFDAPLVASRARSLLTQVVVMTPERVSSMTPREGTVVAGVDVVAEIELAGDTARPGPATTGEVVSAPVRVPIALGLHARPAAVLADAARAFASDVFLLRGDARANAKGVVSLMALEVNGHDIVRVAANGPDADEAVRRLVPLIASGLGDPVVSAPDAAATAGETGTAVGEATPGGDGRAGTRGACARARPVPAVLTGVGAAPGLAVGRACVLRHAEVAPAVRGGDPREERRRLERAIEQARTELQALQARLGLETDAGRAAIFAAHEALLGDVGLHEAAAASIAAGRSAGFAWQQAVSARADRLAGLSNTLLAARATDLRDVGRRVLRLLTGTAQHRHRTPARAIVIADDLSPSDAAALDRTHVLGLCTTGGGVTSHVAILARALGLPAVVAIDPRALDLADGTPVVLDANAGTLHRDPPADEIDRVERRQQGERRRHADDLARALEPAVTRDGHRVEVAGNVTAAGDVARLVALGGDGVGLLRSEFLFLDRAAAPPEDEQAARYTEVAASLGDRPLTIRVLDAGGDKPLAWLPSAREDNPFLGQRGMRLLLERPGLLRSQLRAVLRASVHARGRVRVMFPMVARLDEWRRAKSMLDEETTALGVAPVPAGVVVETPAAALLAERFARDADFLSIGTNDLTQFTLAMDRGHPKLAALIDGLEPSVLHLVAGTVEGARAHARRVGVCGALAADTLAVAVLLGLGVDEFSVSVPAIPAVKALIRTLDLATCRALAADALRAATSAEVRALVRQGLP